MRRIIATAAAAAITAALSVALVPTEADASVSPEHVPSITEAPFEAFTPGSPPPMPWWPPYDYAQAIYFCDKSGACWFGGTIALGSPSPFEDPLPFPPAAFAYYYVGDLGEPPRCGQDIVAEDIPDEPRDRAGLVKRWAATLDRPLDLFHHKVAVYWAPGELEALGHPDAWARTIYPVGIPPAPALAMINSANAGHPCWGPNLTDACGKLNY